MADVNVDRLLEAGSLDLGIMLQSRDPALVEQAVRAMARAFTHAHSIQRTLDQGVLTPLRDILANGKPEHVREAAKAVANLCCYGTTAQRGQLVSSDVLQPYCELFARAGGELVPLVLTGLTTLLQAAEEVDSSSDSFEDRQVKPLCLKLGEIGILDLVHQAMQGNVDEGVRCQAQELSINVRFHTRGEDLIFQDGKVFTPRKIVQELNSLDLGVQERAARAARRMLSRARDEGATRLDSVSNVMVEAGVFQPLLAAFNRDACFVLQHEVVWTLASITFAKGHVMAVVDGGTIPKLLALLGKESEVAAQAAIVLGNIAGHGAPARATVLERGLVGALLPHLRPGTPVRQLVACTWAFRQLCALQNDAKSLPLDLVTPVLPYVAEVLTCEHKSVLVSGCGIVQGQTYYSHEGVGAVLAVPTLPARVLGLLGHKAVNVQEAALKAVVNMMAGTDSQVDCLLEAGCLDHLAPLLGGSEPALVEQAAWAFRNMFCHTEAQIQPALEKGFFIPLLKIFADGELKCQVQAAGALQNICCNGSEEQLALMMAGGVLQRCSAALEALDRDATGKDDPDDPSQTLKERVCHIVSNILHDQDLHLKAALGEPGLLERLLALLSHSSVKVQEAAVDSVVRMIEGTEAQVDRCLDAGFLDHIVPLLQSSEATLVEYAVYAIRIILGGTTSHKDRALQKDILGPLGNILANGTPASQADAAEAIANLCLNASREQRQCVVSSGVLKGCGVLLATLDPTGKKTLSGADGDLTLLITTQVGRVFANLAHGPEEDIEAAQAVPGATAWLVELLDHPTLEVQQTAIRALVNMLTGSEIQVTRCLDAGGLDRVIPLLRCSAPSLVEWACLFIVIILAREQHFIQRALDRAVLTPLKTLLVDGPPKYQKHAAWAITNLCSSGSPAQRSKVLTSGVLAPYCRLLEAPDEKLVKRVLQGLDFLLETDHRDFDGKALRAQLRALGVCSQSERDNKMEKETSCCIC